jgi:hypothetical protein
MEQAAGRATHLLAALGRPMLSLALHSHAVRTTLVVLQRWAQGQAPSANRGPGHAAGSRLASQRRTSPDESPRAMPRIVHSATTERNLERGYDTTEEKLVIDASWNNGTIPGVESGVTAPPSGTCAVAPPIGSSPGTFRIPR